MMVLEIVRRPAAAGSARAVRQSRTETYMVSQPPCPLATPSAGESMATAV